MFRSSTIIRELALNVAKFIFVLKHSEKLRRYLLRGCVAACHGMACVLYAVQNAPTCIRTHGATIKIRNLKFKDSSQIFSRIMHK